jgi:hypothetical protein
MATPFRWLLASLLLCPAPLSSQDQAVVVRAARMLDVSTGRMVSPAAVTVKAGRIEAVGGTATAGNRTVDLGDVWMSAVLYTILLHCLR